MTFPILVILIKSDLSETDSYENDNPKYTLCINEVQYANLGNYLDSDGDNSDWIELYNYGDEEINLGNFSLADHAGNKGRWQLPKVKIGPHQYLLVWASGKDKITDDLEMHTDFLIKSKDIITLYDNDNNCIDQLYVNQKVDPGISVGRLPKQPGTFALLSNCTPGSHNNAHPISYVTRTDDSISAPVLSKDPGIYENSFELSLTTDEEDAVIVYTLDGSDPDTSSEIYKKPILITDRSDEENTIANVKTTPNYVMNYRWENTYFYKGLVVKARTMKNGILSDEITTGSYFVNPDTEFDIVSLSINPDDLFDKWDGLYVPGETYYLWKKYNKGNTTFFPPANYHKDDKLKAYLEIFDNSRNSVYEGNVQISITGGASRTNAAKGLKVKFADNNNFFPDSIFGNISDQLSYDQEGFEELVLRPSGSDFNKLMFIDSLAQEIVADELNVTTQYAKPSVLFIDGEYWGIHNIRESYDEEYFERHFGIERKNLVVIKLNKDVEPYLPEISSGSEADLQDYNDLISYVSNHDLSEEKAYDYVCSKVDIDSLIDYFIAEMYYGNDDWPGNNFKIWRASQNGSEYGDNKWRFVFYDIDNAFLYPEFNTVDFILTEEYDKKQFEKTELNYDSNRELILGLIKNEEFKSKFFARFEECLETVFAPENVLEYIDKYEKMYSHEMNHQFDRWHTTDGWFKKIKDIFKFVYTEKDIYTYKQWEHKLDKIKIFAAERADNLRNYISEYNAR